MNPDALLGVNQALDQMFLDIWTTMLDLLRNVVATLLGLGALDVTDVRGGPIATMWPTLLGIAGAVAVALFLAHLTMAAFNPRRHLARAVSGPVQFAVAVGVAVGVVSLVLGAADGLTGIVLQEGAGVGTAAEAVGRLGIGTSVQGVKPVALALIGIVVVLPVALLLAVEVLFRSAAILVLVATLPLTAVGLVGFSTRRWFWRAVRWLLAAIGLKPLLALLLAVGSGLLGAPGADPGRSGLTTLLLGLGVLVVALAGPLALYRLLAVVEPGTPSHEALRTALADRHAAPERALAPHERAGEGSPLSAVVSRRWRDDVAAAGSPGAERTDEGAGARRDPQEDPGRTPVPWPARRDDDTEPGGIGSDGIGFGRRDAGDTSDTGNSNDIDDIGPRRRPGRDGLSGVIR